MKKTLSVFICFHMHARAQMSFKHAKLSFYPFFLFVFTKRDEKK